MPVWDEATKAYADLCERGRLIEDSGSFVATFCVVNDLTLVTNT